MRRLVLVSQRVDIHPDYGERRDALDQKWAELLWEAGCMAAPIPSHEHTVEEMLTVLSPGGILLTGGNDPASYGGKAPERDKTDELLIAYAVKNNIPLLGVCRGMQSVALYFDGSLRRVEGHVAIRHTVDGEMSREVNSFHNYAIDRLPDELEVLGRSADGVVECVRHTTLPILGVMWHPERETGFDHRDMTMLRELFG